MCGSVSHTSFSFILSLSNPGGCRGYADVAQSVEHRTRRYALVQVQPSAPDVCYRIAAPWKGKTATRGLPVRCMKAAGRRIYYLAGPGLCKRNGCDRHTGAGLKSSVGYRHCYTLRECRGVQWMWRGGGNRMIRPLCKQFKRSAMPGACVKNTGV